MDRLSKTLNGKLSLIHQNFHNWKLIGMITLILLTSLNKNIVGKYVHQFYTATVSHVSNNILFFSLKYLRSL